MGRINPTIRKLKRQLKQSQPNAPTFIVLAIILVAGFFVYANTMTNRRESIHPAAHVPLLTLIARVESSDNYNAYFSNPNNSTIDFTSMSIEEVMAWQQDFVRQGSPSSAVGRYQIISTTLNDLVQELRIDTSEKFDKTMQDTLAIRLIERRGAVAYVNDEISREEFAANLAKEWAALPKIIGDNPQDSYYASDGLNKSRVKVNQVLEVIQKAYS